MPTSMRPRSGPHEAIRYSTYQYKPEHLVYDSRWTATPLAAMAAALECLIPEGMRPAWVGALCGCSRPRG